MTETDFDREKVLADMERVTEAFRVNVVEPIEKLAPAIVEALRPAMEAFAEAAKGMYAAVYSEYVACGAIYGETDEGFLRWLEEIGEVSRLENAAQRIRQRHEDLADLRQTLRKRGQG